MCCLSTSVCAPLAVPLLLLLVCIPVGAGSGFATSLGPPLHFTDAAGERHVPWATPGNWAL
jgi:hypothetical protein